MRRLSLVAADGARVEVDRAAWKSLSYMVVDTADELCLPLPAGSLGEIARWMMQERDELLHAEVTVDFVRDFCSLFPKEGSHAFHVLAQQIARSLRELYVPVGGKDFLSEVSSKLHAFLIACPQLIRPYVNIYFYLLLRDTSDSCLCEEFKQATTIESSERALIDAIYDLPGTKDRALRLAVVQKKERYCLYLLALGANPGQKIAIKKTCLCAHCSLANRVDVDRYTMVPLIRFARSMHTVEAAMQKILFDTQ